MAHSSSSSSSFDSQSSSSTYSSSTSSEGAFTYTCSDADSYFGVQSHIKCYDWQNWSRSQRCAAFNQARREIEMFLGEELHDPVTSEWPINHFYACCEQAIFDLEWTNHRASKDLTTSMNLNDAVDNNFINSQAVTLCVQCQRWLGLNRNTVQGY